MGAQGVFEAALAGGAEAALNLGRPLTRPYWPFILVMLAAVSAATMGGAGEVGAAASRASASRAARRPTARRRRVRVRRRRTAPGAWRRPAAAPRCGATDGGRCLYSSIAVASAVAFVGELALCVASLAWYGARRAVLGRDEARRGTVAVYCGFGYIPGERDRWDGNSLKGGIGGSEQCAIRLSAALAARGVDVVVYCRCGAPSVVDGVRYEPTARFDPWGGYASLIVWRLPQFLLAQRLGGLGGLCVDAGSVAYWIHDGAYLELLRRGGAPFRAAIAFAVRGADSIVFPSHEMREAQYAALFPAGGGTDVQAKAATLPHGVPRYFDADDGEDEDAAARRDGWLLWPVSVERGLDDLLGALPRLRAAVEGRGGDFKLVVCHHAAGYHDRRRAKDDVAKGVRDAADVVFAGMLAPRDLAEMLRRCALFVFPSTVPEAFSLSAWECACHGVVPVCYRRGALAALGDVGCPLVPPDDLDALVDEAVALLADPARASRKRRAVLAATAEKAHTWDTAASAWAQGPLRPVSRDTLGRSP